MILRQTEDKKKLEEAEKARDLAKQNGYDIGVAKTEETLRVEVAGACRHYCSQVWDEALNQAGVEASFALRREENVYYPSTIRPSGSLGSQADSVSSEAGEGQGSPSKAPSAANTSPKEAEQAKDATKSGDISEEVIPGAALPLVAPKDTSKEKEASQSMELVLTTLSIPPKVRPKCPPRQQLPSFLRIQKINL